MSHKEISPLPKISIVIATFNAAKHLAACLDSCVSQTWPNKEVIVIDGASTDDTVQIIRKYSDQIAFWCSEPDKGIYDAWNKALAHVTGSWVIFRGADDTFWKDHTLEKAAAGLLEASPNELLCYGNVMLVNEDNQFLELIGSPWEIASKNFFQRMTIPHAGTFHHISLFQRFGTFDSTYRIAGDYDFLLRALSSREINAKFLPDLAIARMAGGGISHKNWCLTIRESISALRRNGASQLPLSQYRNVLLMITLSLRRKCAEVILGKQRADNLRSVRRRQRSELLNQMAATLQ